MAEGLTLPGNLVGYDEPDFLEQAAREPGMLDYVGEVISGFVAGAYSWPFDYTLCLHWIVGSTGLYGPRVQDTCERHANRIISILDLSGRVTYYLIFRGMLIKALGDENARRAMGEALSRVSGEDAARVFMDHLPELTHSASRFIGRTMTGAAFTAWMQTGGRIGRAVGMGRRVGIASFNFIALLWGAALHASLKHPGDFDIVSVMVSWLTGDPNFHLSQEAYTELYRAAMAVSEAAGVDPGDFENYREVMNTLHRFGRTGGDL